MSPNDRLATSTPFSRPGFAALGPDFFSEVAPQPLPQPYWVSNNAALARELGLHEAWLSTQEALETLSGNAWPQGTRPLASVYAGHQFGVWAGQLGDGRALLLGELTDSLGQRQEVQLKGAGLTPYSRMGDGRAVLRSSIREYLCSEAMHSLGIATTRALCITGSDEPVYREKVETAAVVTRVATSFVRFGHFEYFCHLHHSGPGAPAHQALQQLTDWVIARHYPECLEEAGPPRYARFLAQVALRTADLMAHWQAVGFCHGVMNTDNMSILGLTIDYGPFQFMDGFAPGHVCNHSDRQGRYAFDQQPQVAYWNLFCLAQSLLPLLEDTDLAVAALEPFRQAFAAAFAARMRAKLGQEADASPNNATLADDLLRLMANDGVDYTIFWRRLSQWVATSADVEASADVADLFVDRGAARAWLQRYTQAIDLQQRHKVGQRMLATNPKFVLRNHLAEQAIRRAQEKDFTEVATLLRLLQSPFDEHPGHDAYAAFPPSWAASLEISCSS